MGLIKLLMAEAAETPLRAFPLIGERLLEIKGEMIYNEIKNKVGKKCHPNHYLLVIDTKTEEWKTAEDLNHAQKLIERMNHPAYCYVRTLTKDLCLFFEKYDP